MTSSTIHRIKMSLRGCKLKPSLGLYSFEEEFTLDLLGFLISLPFLDRWHREPEEIMDKWGIYYETDGHSIVLCWKNKTKFIHMPWGYDHMDELHMVQCEDGSWERHFSSWETGHPDKRHIQEFPYKYVLKNGEVQERIAKIHVERREWRRKFLKWCPWFAMKRQSIDIQFNDEVGERSGSWKGGCIGCSYEMKNGETAEQTLRRMERERKFN